MDIAGLWGKVNDSVEKAQRVATYAIMDSIIKNQALRTAASTVMLSANAAQVVRNTKGTVSAGETNPGKALGLEVASGVLSSLGGAIGLIDIAVVTSAAAALAIGKAGNDQWQEVWEKSLVLPNIEGIPISATTVNTSRQVDVGEQMMIVQSDMDKSYWSDNAVPKLKEWTIEGYLMPALMLDSMYIIRPSLSMQMNSLDLYASSRRPVLFKDSRGKFMFVQITNLQTTEDASYNNAIKIEVSLKEYKPFKIDNEQAAVEVAKGD